MKNKIFHLMGLCVILWATVACGTVPSATQAPANTPANNTPTSPSQPLQTPESDPAAETGCEEFFKFCVTSTLSGAVNATATAGMGGNVNDCTMWVEDGEARILELPMMLAAGDEKITVALTRIGAYTGPGTYELKAVTTSGITDMFPAIEAGGRTFSNGAGSTALVTIAPDGSGTIQATGLVEQPSMQVSSPDPAARVDFSMQWTCQGN